MRFMRLRISKRGFRTDGQLRDVGGAIAALGISASDQQGDRVWGQCESCQWHGSGCGTAIVGVCCVIRVLELDAGLPER